MFRPVNSWFAHTLLRAPSNSLILLIILVAKKSKTSLGIDIGKELTFLFKISSLRSKFVGRKSTTRPPPNLDFSFSSKSNNSIGGLLEVITICFFWSIKSLNV